ncbi:PaaI family thioesterase [Bosea sp. (in: a-proteobacteria)]|uniref:PaaI family thioesterase n=1 Tax=Bosea sp. (in: a-proteobacteria) TaxID=1871050 RepID=UPI0026191EE6|nr:PaaI family thioesterase [Bosea sp. (in: a-proteobacteria)]MCO5092874.1 PaaI family thioesterase [Bosea sp. (in: a-proteobacteria)]
MTTRMTAAAIEAYLDEAFPQIHHGGRSYFIEDVGPMTARMRCDYHEKHLRPGGTISGPTMMALADLSLYAAILAQIGPVGLAVTTSLNFNFLRKPGRAALIGEAKLLKLGKRLAVGEVGLYSQGEPEMVCHATGTYSIPAER